MKDIQRQITKEFNEKIVAGKNYEKCREIKESKPLGPNVFPLESVAFALSDHGWATIPDFLISSFCTYSDSQNIIKMTREEARMLSSNLMFLSDYSKNYWIY